jgi:hypothetical protein
MGPPLSAGPHAVIAKVTLAAWKDYLTMVYLGAVFATFLLGQLHALVQRVHYVGYASAKFPENLEEEDRDMKCAVYAVTLASVLALDHPISWRHYDQTFIGRSYWRNDE